MDKRHTNHTIWTLICTSQFGQTSQWLTLLSITRPFSLAQQLHPCSEWRSCTWSLLPSHQTSSNVHVPSGHLNAFVLEVKRRHLSGRCVSQVWSLPLAGTFVLLQWDLQFANRHGNSAYLVSCFSLSGMAWQAALAVRISTDFKYLDNGGIVPCAYGLSNRLERTSENIQRTKTAINQMLILKTSLLWLYTIHFYIIDYVFFFIVFLCLFHSLMSVTI